MCIFTVAVAIPQTKTKPLLTKLVVSLRIDSILERGKKYFLGTFSNLIYYTLAIE